MTIAPDWDHYQSLQAVLRTGSLSAAARGLNLTQPTVGRHIEQLEQALGLPLFTRSPQGLKPTDFALRLTPYLETMAAAAQAALREASGEVDQAAGVVRVAASEVIGGEVLPAILTAFHEQHPQVAVELTLSNRNEDLLRREADIAVRMARPTQAALVARRIGAVRLGLYAHRRYVDAHGAPQTPEQLAALSLIGFDRAAPINIEGLSLAGMPLSRELFSFRTDHDLAQLAAVRAGFGVGVFQHGVARRDPELIPILPDQFALELETWVVMHEDLKASRRMRLMFDHLAAALSDYVASTQTPAEVTPAGAQ